MHEPPTRQPRSCTRQLVGTLGPDRQLQLLETRAGNQRLWLASCLTSRHSPLKISGADHAGVPRLEPAVVSLPVSFDNPKSQILPVLSMVRRTFRLLKSLCAICRLSVLAADSIGAASYILGV